MKTWKIIFSAFLCVMFITQSRLPVFASDSVPSTGQQDNFHMNQADSRIFLKSDFPPPFITKITEDMEITPGTEVTLTAAAEGGPITALQWSLSRDGGVTYEDISGTDLSLTIHPQLNQPVYMPYYYKLRVSNPVGASEATVQVLVSENLRYEHKKLESNGVTVEGLIYKDIQDPELVVIRQPASRYPRMEALLEAGHVPLSAYEVHLEGGTEGYYPYIGTLQITFPVGAIFDSQFLRVFHERTDQNLEILLGQAASGRLKVSTDSLSPFMIEVPRDKVYKVEVVIHGRGSVTPDGTIYVAQNESQSFVMTGDFGYAVKRVRLDGQNVSFSGNTFTIKGISQDHVLEVIFTRYTSGGGGGGSSGGPGSGPGGSGSGPGGSGGGPGSSGPAGTGTESGSNEGGQTGGTDGSQKEGYYQITVKVNGNGSVSPAGPVTVKEGDSRTFYFYPQKGYKVGQVLVNGAQMTILGTSYTFTAVTENAELEVSFVKKTGSSQRGQYTITATAGEGGSISPDGVSAVLYGGDFYVYYQPDEGYQVSRVTVDGKETEPGEYYQFVNVTSDRSIHVEFEKSTQEAASPARYEVNVKILGGNGTVSPEGAARVSEGGNYTLYFYPSQGYEVGSLTVNGEETVRVADSYTLENIRENKEVEVTFVPRQAAGAGTNEAAGIGLFKGWITANIHILCWLIPLLILMLLAVLGFYVLYWKRKKDQKK